MSLDAKDARPYLRLTAYYQQANKGPEALAQMKQYLALAGEKATPQELQQYVHMLGDAKLYDQALQAIDQSTTAQFSVAQRLVLKGQIALAQQQYQLAKDLFTGAVESEPIAALTGRAEAWRGLGQLDQRLADLETVRGKNGVPPFAIIQLAELYATYRNDYTNAKMLLIGVLNDNPRDQAAMQMLITLAVNAADIPTAGEWVATGIKVFPREKSFLRFSAELKRAQKLYPEAIADMQAANKLDDKDTEGQVALAKLYIEGGQPAEAAKQIDLLRQNKDLAAITSALSGQLLAATAPAQADKEFADALKSATDNQLNFVLQCISQAYGPKQDLAKLKAWVNLRADGKDWHYYYQVGTLAISRGLTDQAIELLEQADKLSASSSDTIGRTAVTRQLGLAYYYLKRYEDALRLYDQTLELTKNEVQTLNNKAWLLAVDMKRPADAVAPAKAAYESAPARVEIVDTYGYVLFLSGDYENAAKILEKGANLGGTPELLYHLASTYKKLNRTQEYRDFSRKAWDAVQKNPQHPNFQEIKDNWEQNK
jgi:tetratricopeptide (TPR) repeat protein